MDRLRWAWVAWALGFLGGCTGQNAVLLTLTADAPVDQYQLSVRDDATATEAYASGFTRVPGEPALDLTRQPLKLALKLSRGGRFTLLAVGVAGPLQEGRPGSAAKTLFWAGRVEVAGTTRVTAHLLSVPPGDDRDGDYFPDREAFMRHVPAAAARYSKDTSLLDCEDRTDYPKSARGLPIGLRAAEINPFAREICGDGYDANCNGDADEACVDADGDGDPAGQDCDDRDPARHHPTKADPFPDPPNCCGYSLGRRGTPTEHINFLGQPLCPKVRCGDGIDQSCRGGDNDASLDTTCLVDDDCDGYLAPPQGDDCDDHDPAVHPNAPEGCGATRDLDCNGVVGAGCVPCDLDGDGFQRLDPANGCPDTSDRHPGLLDCNDDDAGIFPGATALAGGREGGGTAVGKVAAALRGFCRRVYESTGLTGSAKINPFGGLVGDADCDGVPFAGCPGIIEPGCDRDGDGWPGVAQSNGKNCNPGGLTLDCDDGDPTVFPSAPVNCRSGRQGLKENCQPAGEVDCSGDLDGDGYAAPADCDDQNPAVHPWAIERCDGIDNDCDGLIDEGNPDPAGAPLLRSGSLARCTDSNTGECGKQEGSCVCSPSRPVKDPLLAQLGQPRLACPGETSTGRAPGCFGAGQPRPQSCDATHPKDDDCDGRVDAPDGARLAAKGADCGISVGQCRAGVVVGCDSRTTNCFTQFGRAPASAAWLVCSTTAPQTVCPTAEVCDGIDNDCDGQLAGSDTPPTPAEATDDERDHDGDHYLACSGCGALGPGLLGCGDCNDQLATTHPGALERCNGLDDACTGSLAHDGEGECDSSKPTCCGSSGCRDLQTDLDHCQSCDNACSASIADTCTVTGCSCGQRGAPCADGLVCRAGSCVGINGAACTLGGECQSGFCADGRCCQQDGCGTCRACTGAAGTCAFVPAGTAGNGCPDGVGNQVCDGAGHCKRALGQTCAQGSECQSGFCADGFCCNSACTGQCQACGLAGKEGSCTPVLGAPVSGGAPARSPCNATDASCAGSCDGLNVASCTYPNTACPSQCTPGGGATPARVTARACSAGACAPGKTELCNGIIKCDASGTACAAQCATDADCDSAHRCGAAHTCQPPPLRAPSPARGP